MEWNLTKIAKWHRQALCGCKVTQQRKKLHLECREYFDALKFGTYAAKLEELADVYIAAAALYMRFKDFSGWFVVQRIEKMKAWPEIADAVDAKMAVNVEREFVLIGDEWRHK